MIEISSHYFLIRLWISPKRSHFLINSKLFRNHLTNYFLYKLVCQNMFALYFSFFKFLFSIYWFLSCIILFHVTLFVSSSLLSVSNQLINASNCRFWSFFNGFLKKIQKVRSFSGNPKTIVRIYIGLYNYDLISKQISVYRALCRWT